MLTEDGAEAELKTIEGTGDAESGVGFGQWAEQRVACEMAGDEFGAGVEVEEIADAVQQGGQDRREGVAEFEGEGVFLFKVRYADPAGGVAYFDGAGVGVFGDEFHAFEFAAFEESQDAGPVVGRAIGEQEGGSVRAGELECVINGLLAEAGRGHAVAGAEGVVETAQACEAAGEGDIDDGEFGFGQELLGEEQAAGKQELNGWHAEFFLDDTTDLAGAEIEFFRDGFEGAGFVVVTFFDALDDEVGNALGAIDGGMAGSELWATTKTGAEACLLGFGCGGVEAAVLFHRRLHGADGAAIDVRGGDGHEEEAVEAAVAGKERLVERFAVGLHRWKIR